MQNPIIQRELIGMLRTRKAVAVLVALAAVLALLVVVRWPDEGLVGLGGEQSRQVLRVFGYGLLVLLVLLAPVFPAASVVGEKQRGTLALLLNSPLSPMAIVGGKLAGAVGYVLLLVIVSLPAAAACFAMGGVTLGQVGWLYAVLGITAIQYATLALLVSSYAQTTDGALRLTYLLILLLAVVTLGPYRFLSSGALESPLTTQISDWVRSVSPVPAMAETLGDTSAGTAGGTLATGGVALRYVIVASVLSLIFAIATAVRVGGRMLDRPREAGTVTDERTAGQRVFRRIMYLWFFDPQRRSGLIGPLTNPVRVKEQRCRKFGRGHWMMRALGACLIISLGLMLLAAYQSATQLGAGDASAVGQLGGVMVVLQIALIVLITPSLASGLIAGEVESRGWQLLQMTPLSPVTIVIGKLQSVVVPLALLLLATLPGYVVLIAIQPEMLDTVIAVLITLALTAVMTLLVAAAVSSVFPTTSGATAVTYALLLGLCGGTMLFHLGRDAPFGRSLVEAVLTVNPLAAALSLIRTPGFATYELVPVNWYVLGGLSVAAVMVLTWRVWKLSRPR